MISSAVEPYARLGSTYVFSENSFQLITPIASGEEASAAFSSCRSVAPFSRPTTLEPPTRRASKPGAAGAIQRPPRAWTAAPSERSLAPNVV